MDILESAERVKALCECTIYDEKHHCKAYDCMNCRYAYDIGKIRDITIALETLLESIK